MILNKKIFVKSKILNYKFFFLSDFELKVFRPVRFRNKIFSFCQILNQKFSAWSDFESKFFRFVRFRIETFFVLSDFESTFLYNASDYVEEHFT